MFLFVADGGAVLGPGLRGVDADVLGTEDGLGRGDELVVQHDAAQRDRWAGKGDDAAELIAGLGLVTPFARAAGIHRQPGYTAVSSC